KAAGKTDGQRIGTEDALQVLQHGAWFVAAQGLIDGAAAHKFDHPRLQAEMSFPELAVVDVVDTVPDFGLAAAQMPSRSEMTVVEPEHVGGQPGRNMEVIIIVAATNHFVRFARGEQLPQGASNFSVQ